jgi:hypothetical protein
MIPPERSRRRCDDYTNINIGHGDIAWGFVLCWCGSGLGQGAGLSVRGSELSSSIKCREFVD